MPTFESVDSCRHCMELVKEARSDVEQIDFEIHPDVFLYCSAANGGLQKLSLVQTAIAGFATGMELC